MTPETTDPEATPDCLVHQIAIEKRLHGALEAEQTATLDQHLAGCETCRAFDRIARETEALMKGNAARASRNMDWDKLMREVNALTARNRQLLLRSLGLALLSPALWLVQPALGAGLLGAALAVAASQLVEWRRSLALASLPTGDQIVTAYEEELEHQLETKRQAVVWCALGCVGWLAYAGYLMATAGLGGKALFGAALGLAFGALALNVKYRMLPRMARRREAFGK